MNELSFNTQVRKSNYAIKPIAEQALRSNQTIVPQRLIAALAVRAGSAETCGCDCVVLHSPTFGAEDKTMGVTSVRLQPEIEDGLEAMSGRVQRSKSWLINQALREYISREALAEERWKETLSALESLNAGNVAEGEEVHAWLRSWGSADELPAPKSRA